MEAPHPMSVNHPPRILSAPPRFILALLSKDCSYLLGSTGSYGYLPINSQHFCFVV
jgi:hypothetical protein